jgi:hypothetical protein
MTGTGAINVDDVLPLNAPPRVYDHEPGLHMLA